MMTLAARAGQMAICVAVLAGAPSTQAAPSTADSDAARATAPAIDDFNYAVKAGDSPWNISGRFLLDLSYWRRLVVYNRIADDRRMAPGTVLRIPLDWLKLTATQVGITGLSGTVEIDRGQGWQRAATGQELATGHQLRTLANSSATLRFDDGSTTIVRELSELRVLSTGRVLANAALLLRLELVRGSIENEAHNLRKSGGRFDIQTPAAVTSVRGTQFRVSADGAFTRSEVIDGAVALHRNQGAGDRGKAGIVLSEATGSRVAEGKEPEPRRALLAAPDLSALPVLIHQLPSVQAVSTVPGAQAYRTQLLRGGVVMHDLLSNNVAIPDIADGVYLMRVRAIDELGLEGLNAQRNVELRRLIVPLAPVALADPVPQLTRAAPDGRQLQLAWSAANGAALFQLQMRRLPFESATAAAGETEHAAWQNRDIVLDDYAHAPALALPMPVEGHYQVRVRVAPQQDKEPAWSEVRSLTGAAAEQRWRGFWSAFRR